MVATGLCVITKGSGKTADTLTLAPEWKWSTGHIDSWARETEHQSTTPRVDDGLGDGLKEAAED
jgi:hypothetical protein